MTITVATAAIPRRRTFFIGLSLIIALIAVVGFWRTYYGPLLSGTLSQPLLIHVHALVFTGWLLLFLAQAVFAATRRLAWHVRIGQIGIAYGALLIVVGSTTGVLRAAALPLGGPAERLLFAASADMVMFSGFFAAAVWFRRKPQLHKRLMVVAATTLLVAAVGRMSFLPAPPARAFASLTIWATPLLLAMAYDLRTRHLVHPIYLVGLAAMVVRRFSVPFVVQTPGWAAFVKWVAGWAT